MTINGRPTGKVPYPTCLSYLLPGPPDTRALLILGSPSSSPLSKSFLLTHLSFSTRIFSHAVGTAWNGFPSPHCRVNS